MRRIKSVQEPFRQWILGPCGSYFTDTVILHSARNMLHAVAQKRLRSMRRAGDRGALRR